MPINKTTTMNNKPQTPYTSEILPETSKGGRPSIPENERKSYPVKVYFDKGSYKKLCRISTRENLSLSSIVYQLVVNGKITSRLSTEETSYIRKLAGMANNLNQLTHLSHIYGIFRTEEDLNRLLKQIDEIIVKISEH